MPKFNEVMGNIDAKIEEEEKAPQQPKQKRPHTSVYSSDHKHIPMTRTDYIKQGSKWKQVGEPEKSIISRNQAQMALDSRGLPFESSHRLVKKDRYGHSYPYDTFSSISPDRANKTVWNVDYAQGDKNFSKLVRKAFYDRMRYKKKKEALKQQKTEGDK